jgi:hypothetical protein
MPRSVIKIFFIGVTNIIVGVEITQVFQFLKDLLFVALGVTSKL